MTMPTTGRRLRAFIVFSSSPTDLPKGVHMRRDSVIVVNQDRFLELTRTLPKSGEAGMLAHFGAVFAAAQTSPLSIQEIDGIVMSRELQGSHQAFNTLACYASSRDRLLRPTDAVVPV